MIAAQGPGEAESGPSASGEGGSSGTEERPVLRVILSVALAIAVLAALGLLLGPEYWRF